MSKFAPVCPIHIYEAMYNAEGQDEAHDIIGDYFLLLAHDVLDHESEYLEFFTKLRAEREITIIMDNSVIELGTSVSTRTLINACNIVDADVLVIPDELNNGAATSRMAEKFISEWMDNGDDVECRADLMFVPQGNHRSQYEICAKNAAEFLLPHISWIGVARNLTGRLYPSRIEVVQFLDMVFPELKFHMLGFSDNTLDDLETCLYYKDRIEGIDSAVPLRIPAELEHPIQDAGKRGTWWDTVTPTDQMFANVLEVRSRLAAGK